MRPLKDTGQLSKRVSDAVAHFWHTRQDQASKQRSGEKRDQGARGAVTGGAQMDGFIALLTDLIKEAGIASPVIHRERALELPGYFRPTKEWDLLVVDDKRLLAVIEAKSQVGPSFGNNFNNRTEEAMGSALDLWTAYREGAFLKSPQPWTGYIFVLEDCPGSRKPVSVKEPHFDVFPEFKGASYAKRYELFCRKLVRERHYNASAFLLSEADKGLSGQYTEPADDLAFIQFASSLQAHVGAYAR